MTNIRLASRALARTPSFTVAALVALALGIGAATTVFSVADGVLFRPLPYHEPDRLVAVSAAIRARDLLHWPRRTSPRGGRRGWIRWSRYRLNDGRKGGADPAGVDTEDRGPYIDNTR